MSIVAAVKEAVEGGLDEFWALHLPEEQKHAYYRGCRELDRENKDERRELIVMKSAVYAREKYGVRGLCF